MRAALAAAALAALGTVARAAPCDVTVPGYWQNNGQYLFYFMWTNPPTMEVSGIVKNGWNYGIITITKSDNSTVSVKYDTGRTETGVLAPNCSVVSWSDGSSWAWTPELQQPIDVHIVPHVSEGDCGSSEGEATRARVFLESSGIGHCAASFRRRSASLHVLHPSLYVVPAPRRRTVNSRRAEIAMLNRFHPMLSISRPHPTPRSRRRRLGRDVHAVLRRHWAHPR
jgi:hypothetical protein